MTSIRSCLVNKLARAKVKWYVVWLPAGLLFSTLNVYSDVNVLQESGVEKDRFSKSGKHCDTIGLANLTQHVQDVIFNVLQGSDIERKRWAFKQEWKTMQYTRQTSPSTCKIFNVWQGSKIEKNRLSKGEKHWNTLGKPQWNLNCFCVYDQEITL